MTEHMCLTKVLNEYSDGDEGGWAAAFDWLREYHAPKLRGLFMSILQRGIQDPILLGSDGRVWDGHHRLYVAHALGFESVRVKHAREDEKP